MSTILKALRRLEAEQAGGARPPQAPRPGPERPRRRARWLALAIGAALGFSGAAVWTFFGPQASEPAPPAERRAERAVTAPRAERALEPPPAPRPRVAVLEPAPPEAEPEAAAPAPVAAEPEAVPAPIAAAPVAAEPAPAPTPVAAQPKPPPVAVQPKLPPVAVQPKPPPVAVQPKPAPTVRPPPPAPAPAPTPPPAVETPQVVARTVPRVVVTGTQWHPDKARRNAQVQVEGRGAPLVLRIGDAVGPLVVTAIEPSGVVFQMGDVEVRRRVGER